MGKGIDLARAESPIHAQILDDFKDQLLIVLLDRLKDDVGQVRIQVSDVDATGDKVVEFALDMQSDDDHAFVFRVIKKS